MGMTNIMYTNPIFMDNTTYMARSRMQMKRAEYSASSGCYETSRRSYGQFADSARQSTCTGNYHFK